MRITRYEVGDELTYNVQFVEPGADAEIHVRVERFVGGGFAGQVYRVKVQSIIQDGTNLEQCGLLVAGQCYAIKILIPPSGMGLLFRNALYAVGFQGPFQLQVNPAAARAGALWQKFIRQAAAFRFKDEKAVNNVHATFVDSRLGSCGEISDWVEGRTWRLEVDDYLDVLKLWEKGRLAEHSHLGSPEYRAKYDYMHRFVELLHEVGAHEFARQYEWTTCKSQPNALKRLDTSADPTTGLIAVDFRAGLTLLPFLPMSPGDFKLIGQGIRRGSLVQFDRGSIETLEQFIASNPAIFASMPHCKAMLEELKHCETIYRDSVPDITHNHIRLLSDGSLWRTIKQSRINGWRVQNLIDEPTEQALSSSMAQYIVFLLLGIIPLLGRFVRKLWGRPDCRAHYAAFFTDALYAMQAIRGHITESLIRWLRAGRVSAEKAEFLAAKPAWYFAHLPLSILPAGLHRLLTDWEVFREKMHSLFVYPFKLYFNAHLRSEWLCEMVAAGQGKHILSDDDAKTILLQINEPFIQKYLVSLVVHLMTVFVSEVTWLAVTIYYLATHPDTPPTERAKMVGAILLAFHVLPISPGSIVRGIYTVSLAIRERNFKDYNIALFLSFFKIVGYLAFPIQMAYRYPAMARFMASHWATDAVHIVPVFGERGALFERLIFNLCYNWPLTIRRRMGAVAEMRKTLNARIWHLPVAAVLVAGLLIALHQLYYKWTGQIPAHENFWFLETGWPFAGAILAGWMTTVFAGGMRLSRRIILAPLCGILTAIVYSFGAIALERTWQLAEPTTLLFPTIWRCFAFAIFATIAALIREMSVKDPQLKILSTKS
jgi:hypothetical protein